ncbi:MAG TPA: peptidylprolyl isomerase, partial [Burkholderiales bacterium]|nr:peptidylprolyl isomerase [Burkholderiales bacterium]
PLPPRNVLEKQLLERMINERMQLQYGKETGVRVDDFQLEKALTRIAQDNGMTLAAFRDALEKDGISFAKFREDVRAEIVMARIKEREVLNKVVVSDAEIDAYLNTQQARKGREEEYNLAHVLVQVPEQATPEKIRERQAWAQEALSKLQAGEDFRKVAAAYSDAPDALQGGGIGWRPAGRLPAIFLETVEKLAPGDVSGVLRSPNGFHIVKVLEKRGNDGPAVVNQTRVRHILVKTSELVSESDARNRLLQLKERIEHGGDFGELARLHSEDPSASNGGVLGWITAGETVPEFERAMSALAINEVSDPVQTPFGWHLIQVMERRTQDVTGERQRQVARQAIRTRKADEAYQEWVRQLRDRAYVEVRLDEKF